MFGRWELRVKQYTVQCIDIPVWFVKPIFAFVCGFVELLPEMIYVSP